MEKAKEKPPEFFKSIKTSLKSVLKHPEINTKILNDAVVKSNKIVIHTLQFLKLYLLDYYENNNQTLPAISKELINNSMKVVCGEKTEKRGYRSLTKEGKIIIYKYIYNNYKITIDSLMNLDNNSYLKSKYYSIFKHNHELRLVRKLRKLGII